MDERGTAIIPILIVMALSGLMLCRFYDHLGTGLEIRREMTRGAEDRLRTGSEALRDLLEQGDDFNSAGCRQTTTHSLCILRVLSGVPVFDFNRLFDSADGCISLYEIPPPTKDELSDRISSTSCNALKVPSRTIVTKSNLTLTAPATLTETYLLASAGSMKIVELTSESSTLHIIAMGSITVGTLNVASGRQVILYSGKKASIARVQGGGHVEILSPHEPNSASLTSPWLTQISQITWSFSGQYP